MTTTTAAARRSSLQRWRRLFCELVVFGLAVAIPVGWALATRERPLLDQASAVASTGGWKPKGWPGRDPAPYVWLTGHEVAFERWAAYGRGGPRLFRHDTRTKEQTPLPLAPPFNGGPVRVRDVRPSPDGRWLLFPERPRGQGGRMVAAARDGSRRITWPRARWIGSGQAVWAEDGRGWLWIERGRDRLTATLFSLDDPHEKRPVSLPGGSTAAAPNRPGHVLGFLAGQGERRPLLALEDAGGFLPWAFFNRENFFHFPPAAVRAVRAPGPGGAAPTTAPKTQTLPLLAFGLTNGSPPRRIRVPLPAGTTVGTVALSPRGDRLAWLLERETEPALAPLVRRFLPKHPWATRPPRRTTGLWVSRTDGGGLRRIGAMELKPLPVPGGLPTGGGASGRSHIHHMILLHIRMFSSRDKVPGGLRWTPDGKRLSFVYDDTLWTVPAD